MGAGVSDLTLVVRPRDESIVSNYFTVDPGLLQRLGHHPDRLGGTRELYARLSRLRLRYIRQPRATGFGEAVLRAGRAVGSRPFLVHASDAFLDEPNRGEVPRAMGRLLVSEGLDAVLLVRRVRDPRRYGVVEASPMGRFGRWRRLEVHGMVEKPARPKSTWAATAVYAFRPELFAALREVRRTRSPRSELELTDGIQGLLDRGGRVAALVLAAPATWRSVGSPESYYRALHATHLRIGPGG